MKLLTLSALLLFSPVALGAQTLTFSIDVTSLGVDPPSSPPPWATAEFTSLAPNAVEFTFASNLEASEFISEFNFNLDPSLDSTSLVFTPLHAFLGSSGFVLPAIDISEDAIFGGQGSRFDIGLSFETSNAGGGSRRFSGTDSVTYSIHYNGTGEFNAYSFNFGDSVNGVYAQTHVQGIGEDLTSAWATPSIPEPSSALLGLFGFTFIFRKRR